MARKRLMKKKAEMDVQRKLDSAMVLIDTIRGLSDMGVEYGWDEPQKSAHIMYSILRLSEMAMGLEEV